MCVLYGFACGPYSDSDVAGPGVSLEDVFNRRQLNEDGSSSNKFLINEELVAMLDSYVAVSLSAKIAHAEQFKPHYRKQVEIYKAFNGTSGRESWRPQLLAVLQNWLAKFPHAVSKMKSRISTGGSSDQKGPQLSPDDL